MDYTRLLRLPQYFRNLQRLSEIVAVLVRHGFGDIVDRLRLPQYLKGRVLQSSCDSSQQRIDPAVRLKMVFEDLGPTFIKLGQIISTRPDIFPDAVIRECRNLQDHVQPFPASTVREILQSELGTNPDEVFSCFEETPVAAASLAQVHRATLVDGEPVIVKVQRPNLLRTIDTDVEIMKGMAALFEEHIPESRAFNPSSLVEEFARALRKECDFRREARNISQFAELFQDESGLKVPRVFNEISTRRLLVEEYIEGVRADAVEDLRARGTDPQSVIRILERIVLKSVFEHRLYHADPHPGNIFVTADDRIAFVDFGKMGRIERGRVLEILDFLLAVTTSDADGICHFLLGSQMTTLILDEAALKTQLQEILDFHVGQKLGQLDLFHLVSDIFDVIRRHGIKPAPDLLSIGKVLTTLQSIGLKLDPSYDPVASSRPYFVEQHIKALADIKWHMKQFRHTADSYLRFIREFPLQIGEILRKLSRDELKITLNHAEQERAMSHQNALMNRLIMTIIGAAVLSAGLFLIRFADTALESTAAYILLGWGCAMFFLVWLAVRRTGGLSG